MDKAFNGPASNYNFNPIKAILSVPKQGGSKTINGYLPDMLIDICQVMVEAHRAGALQTEKQKRVAQQCDLIRDALCRTGLVALIDEATGYQNSREKDHLQRLFNHYLAPECRSWTKMFPDEFFKQVIRLTGCSYDFHAKQLRPAYVGKFIKDFIYGSFPMGILEEIEHRNPVIGHTPNGSNKRKVRHHQWMSDTVGKQELLARINLATAIMKGHKDIDSFKRHWAQLIAPQEMKLIQQYFYTK